MRTSRVGADETATQQVGARAAGGEALIDDPGVRPAANAREVGLPALGFVYRRGLAEQ